MNTEPTKSPAHRSHAIQALDRFDRAIIKALQLDGRMPNSALADRVNLSESASLRRVRALEESGLSEG